MFVPIVDELSQGLEECRYQGLRRVDGAQRAHRLLGRRDIAQPGEQFRQDADGAGKIIDAVAEHIEQVRRIWAIPELAEHGLPVDCAIEIDTRIRVVSDGVDEPLRGVLRVHRRSDQNR